MKGFKKLLTGILAATMIMGASITAFATEGAATTPTASITINNNLEAGENGAVKKIKYEYYQFLQADVLSADKAVYYVENTTLETALEGLKNADGKDIFKITKAAAEKNRWYVTANDGITADEIVTALNTDTMKALALSHGNFETADNQKTATVNVKPGYYLVLSSLGTKAAIQTLGNTVIDEKNEESKVEKSENKDHDKMFDTENPVVYTVKIKIPESPANKAIVVYDEATEGLTFNSAVEARAVDKVKDITEEDINAASVFATYSWSKPEAFTEGEKNYNRYTLEIPAETVVANEGKTIVLRYSAVINEKAVVYVAEQNTAYIQYDNNNSAKTVPVTVKTFGIEIIKFTKDTNGDKRLTGAEFTLWTDDGTAGHVGDKIEVVKLVDGKYRVASAKEITDGETVETIVVDANGEAFVDGLDATKYYLQEEVAPAGYTMLDHRIEVVVSDKSTARTEVPVENKSGLTLPSTGGMGTTLFYIVGGMLIIAGAAYFILRRKAAVTE